VVVAKPWGREIWFTGMEQRGESRVVTAGRELPLSAYLSVAPQSLCGGLTPVLLKILEPHPVPFAGDLYFELHEQKHEVYVVDQVNPEAHPAARGTIRLGVNQVLRRRLGDRAFRRTFLEALGRFESARRASDAGADPAAEAAARAAVLDFTAKASIGVADVVAVPAGHPHALQHGVRVIEFQTPVYERRIIYATQRVLTQPRWDSAAAVPTMCLEPLPGPRVDQGRQGFEQLAALPGFEVCRLRLAAGAEWSNRRAHPYTICLQSRGSARLGAGTGALELEAGEAAFLPGSAGALEVRAGAGCELLLAFPGS